MGFTKKWAVYLPVSALSVLLFVAGNKLVKQDTGEEEEVESPGFYKQWLEEKTAGTGVIPKWLLASWSAWDRTHVASRTGEALIDSVLEIGPDSVGGRTKALWVDPRNDNVILAGSASGGMWRSENGGKSWSPVNEHEATLSVTSITSNPFNPDIVYYSTGEPRGNSADVGGNGIYKSIDGGKTFHVLPSTVGKAGFEIIYKVAHSLVDSNTFFVGTQTAGLFRTTDGGNTWQAVYTGGSKTVTEIMCFDNNRVIATTQASVAVASDSGGKAGTFTVLSFPTPPSQYLRIQMANCQKFPNVCYAVFEGYDATGYNDTPARIYKSNDYGRTWIRRNSPGNSAGSGQQGYCLVIGVNPQDTNGIIVGGVNLGQSSDGGKTWVKKKTSHSDYHSFSGFTSNTTDYLVGNDGGIYRYGWSGTSVKATLNGGYHVTQFYAGAFGPGGMVCIGGTQDNGTHVGSGTLKSKKFYGSDGGFAFIGQREGGPAYLSTQLGNMLRIDNFNYTTPVTFPTNITAAQFKETSSGGDGVDFINAFTINPADDGQLYVRTSAGVYRSTNSGGSWVKIASRSSIKALATSNDDNPVLYFGGYSAQLYKTENAATAGVSTEYNFNGAVPTVVTNDMIKCITVHPKDKYCIYISFSNVSSAPRIWRASGLDSSKPVFKNVSGNLPTALPVNWVEVDPAYPDKNLFAGTDFGLYYSTDSGKTWTKELRIPNVPVFQIKMRADRRLFVFTHGRGLWYLTLVGGDLGTKNTSKNHVVKCWPNPANEGFQLALNENISEADYGIYDLGGKMMQTGHWMRSANSISTTELANGYYFITLRHQSQTFTTKILVRH